MNEHVLAVVKLREEEVQKEIKTFEIPKLKLTRAKTRQVNFEPCIFLNVHLNNIDGNLHVGN